MAVVGAGYWGRKLVKEYLSLSRIRDDIRLKRIVDCDLDRLKSMASELTLPNDMLLTDLSRLFKDDTVQAVHIATPNDTHFPLGMAVLESRRHLLLEKPMGLTMREAVKLARRAEEQSVVFHVGHIFRFNNAIRQTRSLIGSQIIGKPLYYKLQWETSMKPPEGRDIVFDLGPHPIDVLNYLSNEWPDRVLAVGRSFVRRQLHQEDAAEAIAEFKDDIFACISMSWLYSGPRRRMVSVVGDAGCIEVDALDQQIRTWSGGHSTDHPVQANNTIEAMIAHFVDSILKGEPAQNSALVGTMTVGVLSAMRESMKVGRFVNVLGSD